MFSLERRLARLERAAAGGAGRATPTPASPRPAEIPVIAAQMANNLRAEYESYQRLFGLGPEEALARANGHGPGAAEEAVQVPPKLVSWLDLRTLLHKDPAAAIQKWLELKEATREEIRSGVLAAEAITAIGGGPQGQAQFFALREELISAWQPRNSLEQMLIDRVVQLEFGLQAWFTELSNRSALSNAGSRRASDEPVRLEDAQAIEQAMKSIKRLHDMQMRTLAMLRGLRRRSPRVVVHRARQVNVGDQQINVSAGP